MADGNAHPIDIELLDFVTGGDASVDVREHLGECLLCRVRVGRLRAEPSAWTDGLPVPVPPALRVPPSVLEASASSDRPEPAKGQLWLAGGPASYLLVWIRGVAGPVVICHPVALDVEAADDTTLITDVASLQLPAGVVTSITGTVPIAALERFVGDLDVAAQVDSVRDGIVDGLAVGARIESDLDERLELRQLLADQLALLHPEDSSDEDEDDAPSVPHPVRELYELVAREMTSRRGRECHVAPPMDRRLIAQAQTAGLNVVAKVSELTCSVLVLALQAAEAEWSEVLVPAEAEKLAELADATTIAIVETASRHTTVLFEVSDLNSAIETPDGVARGPRPHLPPMDLGDALFKYLERTSMVTEGAAAGPPSRQEAIDVSDVLHRHARAFVAELHDTGAQTEKRLALRGLDEADGEALGTALSGHRAELLEAIRAIAEAEK